MPLYAILIFCGVLALLGAFLLGGEGFGVRRSRSTGGYDGFDGDAPSDGGWSFGGPTDYTDGGGFDDD